MPRLQAKLFSAPDETRNLEQAHADIVTLDEVKVGLARWEPGWRWSTHLRPLIGTQSCQVHHLGYAISGALRVELDDGQSLDIPGGAVYEIPAGHDAWVVGDEPFVTVEWTSAGAVGLEPDGPGERVLATVLFTDIVDSTATLERIGDAAWRSLLAAHNTALRDQMNRFRGREKATTGDGFLVVFDSASRAVACGAAMVRAAEKAGVSIRVGIHTGEVTFVGSDVRGVAVHTAARVLSVAGPGEVVVSATTHDLLEGSDYAFADAGAHTLKGLSGVRSLHRLIGRAGGD
jgi:class 3 adenylate cyclase